MVRNEYGEAIDFEAAVYMMDEELREELHSELVGQVDEQGFYEAYCELHFIRFGEVWELEEQNPTW